jgi:hypothetical protein
MRKPRWDGWREVDVMAVQHTKGRKMLSVAEREERDRVIMEMHEQKRPNREIATAVGLTQARIEQIIAQNRSRPVPSRNGDDPSGKARILTLLRDHADERGDIRGLMWYEVQLISGMDLHTVFHHIHTLAREGNVRLSGTLPTKLASGNGGHSRSSPVNLSVKMSALPVSVPPMALPAEEAPREDAEGGEGVPEAPGASESVTAPEVDADVFEATIKRLEDEVDVKLVAAEYRAEREIAAIDAAADKLVEWAEAIQDETPAPTKEEVVEAFRQNARYYFHEPQPSTAIQHDWQQIEATGSFPLIRARVHELNLLMHAANDLDHAGQKDLAAMVRGEAKMTDLEAEVVQLVATLPELFGEL